MTPPGTKGNGVQYKPTQNPLNPGHHIRICVIGELLVPQNKSRKKWNNHREVFADLKPRNSELHTAYEEAAGDPSKIKSVSCHATLAFMDDECPMPVPPLVFQPV